jgi:hypothetical protein
MLKILPINVRGKPKTSSHDLCWLELCCISPVIGIGQHRRKRISLFYYTTRIFSRKRRNLDYKSSGFHAVQIIPEYVKSLFNVFFKEFIKRAACIDFWRALSQYAVR